MTSISITRPVGMKLTDWADQVCLDLDFIGSIGKLMSEDDWKNWAVQFLNNLALGKNIPSPYEFKNWEDWADRFCQTLQ